MSECCASGRCEVCHPSGADINSYATHTDSGRPLYACGACGDTGVRNHGSDYESPCECTEARNAR